jgi:hypothetical protein
VKTSAKNLSTDNLSHLQNAAYIRRARMRDVCGETHFCASLAIASPARTKNVHRVGRVSGGLLNPSGGARNRPRNKSVLAQLENELNHNFASGNEIRLTFSGKNRVKGFASHGQLS